MKKDIKEELIRKMEHYSMAAERFSNLVALAAHMLGEINADCVSDSEEIKNAYPGWLEALLDTAAELGYKQNKEMDSIIVQTMQCDIKQSRTD